MKKASSQKIKKTKAEKIVAKKDVTEQKPDFISDKDDDAFNFGGLPQRDLKKNLGCG